MRKVEEKDQEESRYIGKWLDRLRDAVEQLSGEVGGMDQTERDKRILSAANEVYETVVGMRIEVGLREVTQWLRQATVDELRWRIDRRDERAREAIAKNDELIEMMRGKSGVVAERDKAYEIREKLGEYEILRDQEAGEAPKPNDRQ